MKTTIFTLFSCIITAIQLNAQETFQKLIASENGMSWYNASKTNEKNFIWVTSSSGINKLPVVLLNEAGDTLWTTSLSETNSSDYYSSTASAIQTPDKGYLVFSRYVTDAVPAELLFIKLNRRGKLLWTKKVTNTFNSWTNTSRIALAADGNVLLTGSSSGLGNNTGFIMKISSVNGNIIWLKTIETKTGSDVNQAESFNAVLPTKDSGAVICGMSYKAGGSDLLYAKYTKDGFCSWIKRVQATTPYNWPDNYLVAASEAKDGSLVFCGASASGSFDSRNLVLKTDKNGVPVWMKSLPAQGTNSSSRSVVANNDNSYTIAGTFRAYTPSKYSGFIATVNTSGDLVWYNDISYKKLTPANSKKEIRFSSLYNVKSGYIVNGIALRTDINASIYDSAILIKFDTNGNTCNSPAISTTTTDDNGYAIVVITTDTANVLSYIQVKDTSIFTQNKLVYANRDICASQQAIAAAVSIEYSKEISKAKAFTVSMYPNPVKGSSLYLTLNNLVNGNTFISITDLQGKKLYAEKFISTVSQLNKNINIAALAAGMYVINITNDKEQKTLRFIKQ